MTLHYLKSGIGKIVCATVLSNIGIVGSVPFIRATHDAPVPDRAQAVSSNIVSHEEYEAILNALFTKNTYAETPSSSSCTLRFEPSFQPESQIVIWTDVRESRLKEYRSAEGNIYGRINGILAAGTDHSAADLARRFHVVSQEIAIPRAQAARWQVDLLKSAGETLENFSSSVERDSKSGKATIIQDGTTYRLRCTVGVSDIAVSVYDVDVASSSQPTLPLAQLMRSIYLGVKKLMAGKDTND